MTWYECALLGAALLTYAFFGRPGISSRQDGGSIDYPKRGVSVRYDLYGIGPNCGWYSVCSFLVVPIAGSAVPPALDDAFVARCELALRWHAGLWIPAPSFPEIAAWDTPPNLGGLGRWDYWHTVCPRAVPSTGQQVFAGVNVLGILTDGGACGGFILLCLAVTRAGASINYAIARKRSIREGKCVTCGYELDRTWQETCPECGTPAWKRRDG